jgi:hypothetical protein
MANEERLQILDMIASGKISAQQGVELLKTLDDDEAESAGELTAGEIPPPSQPETPMEAASALSAPPVLEPVAKFSAPEEVAAEPRPSSPETQASPEVLESLPETHSFDPRSKKWQGWWQIPLWIGVGATILTGLLMYSLYRSNGFGFWFACSWFPFLLSVAIVALAWASRSAHWLHVRVHQPPGQRPQNIAISFPIPLTLMAWFLRTFRNKIPRMDGMNPDEMILVLNHVSPEKPFYVEVNEENGEHVEVYVG